MRRHAARSPILGVQRICIGSLVMNATSTRSESDSMGTVDVPTHHYWGAQTQRSIENFPIGIARFRWQPPVIRALGILKLAAARANAELGELPAEVAELIERAAREVSDGKLNDEFPLV